MTTHSNTFVVASDSLFKDEVSTVVVSSSAEDEALAGFTSCGLTFKLASGAAL